MHEREKWKWSHSVVSDSSRPHGLQPPRLLHPWDFPGKSIGVGCHCLLQMPFSRSLVFLGKELVHSSGAPNFVTVAQGTPLDHLALADSGTYICSPQDCTYLHTLKADVWGSGFQSDWTQVLTEILHFGTLIGLATPSTTESQNKMLGQSQSLRGNKELGAECSN